MFLTTRRTAAVAQTPKEIGGIALPKDFPENDRHGLGRSRRQARASRSPRRRGEAAALPGRICATNPDRRQVLLESTWEGPWRTLEPDRPPANGGRREPARARRPSESKFRTRFPELIMPASCRRCTILLAAPRGGPIPAEPTRFEIHAENSAFPAECRGSGALMEIEGSTDRR
jgi:hypothetical protein